jgi:hypothetical protein
MSFALVLAIPPMAVVAADTRLNIVGKDGSVRTNDSGPATVRSQGASLITLGDANRKIRGFPGGWAAGVGNLALVQSCLSALERSNARTPVAVEATLRRVYEAELLRIQAAFPDDDAIERTAIRYAYTTQTKFGIGGVSFTDEWKFPADADFYTGAPPDLPAQELEKARSTLRRLDLPADADGVYRIIRVELLPEYTAAAFATWLEDHPGVEIIARDRAGTFADGASQGAPDAVQVAARFHLMKNLREALEPILERLTVARQAEQLDTWLEQASSSEFPELVSLASGIKRDYAAVKAALHSPYSAGPVEGNINRLKFIKSSMYGRANFDLLRHRVLAG